LKLLI